MQRKYTFTTLLTLFFLFVSTALFAQMSDQQVMQELLKYQINVMLRNTLDQL